MQPHSSGNELSLWVLCLPAQGCLPCLGPPRSCVSVLRLHRGEKRGCGVNEDEENLCQATQRFGRPLTGLIASSV